MIDELPAAPDPVTDTPAVFSQKAAAYVLAQKAMVPQINTVLANLNSIAAGGAYAIPYQFSAVTANADPGAGWLRLSPTVNQNQSTTIYLDPIGADGKDYTSIIDTFDASTSTVKGTVRLVKVGDLSKFLTFDVTARGTPTGYRSLSITNTGSSAASPFVTGDSIILYFQRTGDKGDTNSGQPTLHLREERASGTASTVPTNLSLGVNRRPLNVAKVNSITGASLASDQFVLPIGSYDVTAESLSLIQTGSSLQKYWHKMALYNVTDGAYVVIGQNGLSYDPTNNQNYVQMASPSLNGSFSVSGSSKTFELRHLTPNANMAAAPAASAGQVEVYTDLIIKKTS